MPTDINNDIIDAHLFGKCGVAQREGEFRTQQNIATLIIIKQYVEKGT